MPKVTQKQARASKHYVNNREFSEAVNEFVSNNDGNQKIPNYIGECFIKIANKIASRPNFSGYSYKDEMISDGIENCIQAISNYNKSKSMARSKSGQPNAFGYFSLIIWRAFLRRIAKEKKCQDLKEKLMDEADSGDFVEGDSKKVNSITEKAKSVNDSIS